jgi:hypothetical protein
LEKQKGKIWHIARERYKGWRAALSATYKAYNTYAERIRNKPEEIDIVEWHYLLLYFASDEFMVSLVKCTFSNKLCEPKLHSHIPLVHILQKTSSQNSSNRKQQRTTHLMGSKNFSQCSYEQVFIWFTNLVLPFYYATLVLKYVLAL